ncbi:MAG: hypothetical protein ACI39N_03815 [Lachnospiraceae bacterium]
MDNRTIGFRVSPNEVFYAIIENKEEAYEFISISSLKIPVAIDEPQKLSFIRNTISTMLLQYKIDYAGIKLIEGNARSAINNSLIFRFNIEGVLKELLSNGQAKNCFLGLASNISAVLEIEKAKPVEMLEKFVNTEEYMTDYDKKITIEHKEAMLVALAALEEGLKYE